MKRLILAAILTCGRMGVCQQGSQDPYSEKLVSSFVNPNGSPVILSMQEKAVNRLGDRAAIGLARHMGAQAPATPQELDGILSVVRMAFAVPEAISSDADREPKATSMLLSYLSLLPLPGGPRAKIEDTRVYILKQTAEYKAKHAEGKK